MERTIFDKDGNYIVVEGRRLIRKGRIPSFAEVPVIGKSKKVIIKDKQGNSYVIFAKREQQRSVLRGKCPYHEHFREDLVINPYEKTFKCDSCMKEGTVLDISEPAYSTEDIKDKLPEGVVIRSICELFDEYIEKMWPGKMNGGNDNGR